MYKMKKMEVHIVNFGS